MKIKTNTICGFTEIRRGSVFNYTRPTSKTRRGRVVENGTVSPTLETGTEVALLEEEKPIKIRRLTPKECFRLQGWDYKANGDEYYERAAFVNSDSQLYKQAGNGVTVNVIFAIASLLSDDCQLGIDTECTNDRL